MKIRCLHCEHVLVPDPDVAKMLNIHLGPGTTNFLPPKMATALGRHARDKHSPPVHAYIEGRDWIWIEEEP